MNRWIFTLISLLSFFNVFSQVQNEAIFQFSDQENQVTRLSEGVLFDSGGEDADYQALEKSIFTVCPDLPHQTINIEVENYHLERGVDFLKIYDAAEPQEKPYSVVTGYGKNRTYIMPGGCVTFEFESDDYLTGTGFQLKWTTGDDIALMPPPSDCSDPTVIASLPFVRSNLTTCGAGNDYWITPCNSHFQSEEMIFVYDSPGDECIEVIFENADDFTSISIYEDCPNVADDCLGEATIGFLSVPRTRIPRVFFEEPGRYYFMVSQPFGCSDFDVEIRSIDCPVVFPSAALCNEALPIVGCNLDAPSIITVQQGEGDDSFIRDGRNDGCWNDFPRTNFTWFYVEAQMDGDFGFLLSSVDPGETSDIDIQVWGPISNLAQQCNFAQNNEPIRSTFADEKISYDLTGLVNRSPINNNVINDDCENEFGDGFVRTIDVKEGEIYLILVNDYDGIINSGAVSIDFSPTTPGVLGVPNESFSVTPDTVLCAATALQLEADGGLVYRWLASPDLSCLNCPNPIATPSGNATYQVIIGGVCAVDTLSVNVGLPSVELPDDYAVCEGENPQITAVTLSSNATFTWTDPNGYLSCTDCASPIANLPDTPGFYTFEVEADFGDCKATESITIEMTNFLAPDNFIIENAEICEGDDIKIGADAQTGLKYSWRDAAGDLFSIRSNPTVNPTSSQWYFVKLDAGNCETSDSVFIDVSAPPTAQNILPQSICPGESVFLNNDGDQDLNYTWTNDAGNIVSTDPNPELTPTVTTVYQISIESSPACPKIDTMVEITVFPEAELNLEADNVSICFGDSVELTAFVNVPDGTFQWTTGETTESIFVSPSDSTTYGVIYKDPNGCDTPPANVTIEVGNIFQIDTVTFTPDLSEIFEGCELTFTPTISPANMTDLSYEWQLGGDIVGTEEEMTFIFETRGFLDLDLFVTQNGGCEQLYQMNLEILEGSEPQIPNIFSPNGDGINDFFIPFSNGKPVEVVNMVLYNRWGQIVYNNNQNDIGWDGRSSETDQVSDVYIYDVTYRLPNGDLFSEKGDVTLYR